MSNSDTQKGLSPNSVIGLDSTNSQAELTGYKLLQITKQNGPQTVYKVELRDEGFIHSKKTDFSIFENLHTIDASGNRLPVDSFEHVPFLKELNLSCNEIKSINLECGPNFAFLSRLNLSCNNLNETALITLATFPNLQYLNLSHNSLNLIPPEIVHMEKWLAHLQLKTALPSKDILMSGAVGVIGFAKLQELDLSHNNLENAYNFAATLGQLPALKFINVSENNLSNLSSLALCRSKELFLKLDELDISSNNIQLPESLLCVSHISSLKTVYISGNPVISSISLKGEKVAVYTNKGTLTWVKFDPVYLFRHVFGITVADFKQTYETQRIKQKLSLLNKKAAIFPPAQHFDPGNILSKNDFEAKLASIEVKRHVLGKEKDSVSDKDIAEMVRKGHIMSLKDLANEKHVSKTEEHCLTTEINACELASETIKTDTDEEAKDRTFLTGLNIVHSTSNVSFARPLVSSIDTALAILPDVPFYCPKSLMATVKELRFAVKHPSRYLSKINQVHQKQLTANAQRERLETLRQIRTPVYYLPTASNDALARKMASSELRERSAGSTNSKPLSAKGMNTPQPKFVGSGGKHRSRSASAMSSSIANLIISGKQKRGQLSKPSSPNSGEQDSIRASLMSKNINLDKIVQITPTAKELQLRRQIAYTHHPHHRRVTTSSNIHKGDYYFTDLVSNMNAMLSKVRLLEKQLDGEFEKHSFDECLRDCSSSIKELGSICNTLELVNNV